MNTKQTLLMLLQYVRDHESVRRNDSGICDAMVSASYVLEVEYFDPKLHKVRKKLFREWPEGTHNAVFPVRGVLSSPGEAFEQCCNMWSRVLPYGRRRWRLLHWMIAQLEAELQLEKELEHVQ